MADEDSKQALSLTDYKPLKTEIEVQDTGSRRGRQLAPENASQAMNFAQLMSRADKAIPEHLRNNVGMCLAVTLDAMSFGFNPIALARSSYAVGNALSYEAKVYAAALNTSGYLRTRPKISYRGEISGTHKVRAKDGTRDAPGGDLVCTISAYIIGEEDLKVWDSPKLSEIQTKNSPLWYSDPKLQLYYYTLRAWARVYLPEVMLGVQTRDEIDDAEDPVIDVGGEEQAPKQTLIDRVRAKRAEAAKENDTSIISGALSSDAPKSDVVDVVAEDVKAADEDVRTEQVESENTKEAQKEPEPASASVDSQPEQEQPAADKTPKTVLADLKSKIGDVGTIDGLEQTHKDWLWTITDFSKEEQFDLQAEADLLVAKRRVAIRKALREKK